MLKKVKKFKNKKKNRTISLVVLFYFVTSISIVYLNKFILDASPYKFDLPLAVTWF